MKPFFICIVATMLNGCATAPPSREVGTSPHPRADEIRQIMRNEMIIPNVVLQDAPVREAVEFMFTSALEHDPKQRGMGFVLKPGVQIDRRVTITSKDISVLSLLNEICQQADLVWRLTNYVIEIEPKHEEAEHPARP